MQARTLARRLSIPESSQPKCTWSWLRHLHGIRWRRAFGESGAVDLDVAAPEIERLRHVISTYPYSKFYNMDETGLFYDSVPRGSMCIGDAPALKQNKSRINLALCTSLTGFHKLALLFIGKSKNPRWIKDKLGDIKYRSTAKAWMATDTYQLWLQDLVKTMQNEGRHILLLVDNDSSHGDDGVALSNVRIEKLPLSTTSKLQPLDQEILYCLKRDILRTKMNQALVTIDEGVKTHTK